MTSTGGSAGFYLDLLLEMGEVVAYFWPISVGVFPIGVFALIVRSAHQDSPFRGRVRLLAVPYAFPPLVLLLGTVFRYNGPPHPNWREPPAWHGWLLFAPLVLHAVWWITASVRMKGSRLRSAAILLPSVWLTLCAFLLAGFAVSGVGL